MTDTLHWEHYVQGHPHLALAEAQEKWLELQAEAFLLKLERMPIHYSPHTGAILMRRKCEELAMSNALVKMEACDEVSPRFVAETRARDALKCAMQSKDTE